MSAHSQDEEDYAKVSNTVSPATSSSNSAHTNDSSISQTKLEKSNKKDVKLDETETPTHSRTPKDSHSSTKDVDEVISSPQNSVEIGSQESKLSTFPGQDGRGNAIYLLSEFEQQRFQVIQQLHKLCDPVIERITYNNQQLKHITSQLQKFLKDRAKQYDEICHRYSTHEIQVKSSRSVAPNHDEKLASMSEAMNQSDSAHFITMYIPCMTQMLSTLNSFNSSEASTYGTLCEYVEQELIPGVSNDYSISLEKIVHAHFVKLKDMRSRIERQHKETSKIWADFDKYYATFRGKTSSGNIASTSNNNRTDVWLYERRYLTAVAHLQKHCIQYSQSFIETLHNLELYQEYKNTKFRSLTLSFFNRLKLSLHELASALGTAHSEIDLVGFERAKSEYAGSGVASARAQAEKDEPDTPLGTKNLNVGKKKGQFLDELKLHVETLKIPNSQFILKQGFVKRLKGMFSKWSDGMLVLTWDRYLHMFRSHDDSEPLWSLYIPSVEIRIVEEKQQKNIELQDKKGYLPLLSKQIQIFQPRTNLDLQSWVSFLQLASNASDEEFHQEAEVIIQSTDEKELHGYNLHVQEKQSSTNE